MSGWRVYNILKKNVAYSIISPGSWVQFTNSEQLSAGHTNNCSVRTSKQRQVAQETNRLDTATTAVVNSI